MREAYACITDWAAFRGLCQAHAAQRGHAFGFGLKWEFITPSKTHLRPQSHSYGYQHRCVLSI